MLCGKSNKKQGPVIKFGKKSLIKMIGQRAPREKTKEGESPTWSQGGIRKVQKESKRVREKANGETIPWSETYRGLVGPASPLWKQQPEVALAFWLSTPSAVPFISLLVSSLFQILGTGVQNEIKPCPNLSVKPIHFWSDVLPIEAIYVGNGDAKFPCKPSPWLNPFVFMQNYMPGRAIDNYKAFNYQRSDLKNWLYPLSKAAYLVCDCKTDQCSCHAQVLLHMLRSDFIKSPPVNDGKINKEDDTEWDEEELSKWDWGSEFSSHLWLKDETTRASRHVHKGPSSPKAWLDLTQAVRK